VVHNLKGGHSGNFTVLVQPHWSPVGARRFRRLVEEHFFDQTRFFRVLKGFVAQIGISGDPDVAAKWQFKTISDDIVKVTNHRGRVAFASSGGGNVEHASDDAYLFEREWAATGRKGVTSSGIDSRTTQIFVSLGDNRVLDKKGFSPFGEVVHGMEVVDELYSGYGEGAPRGHGPDQNKIQKRGNAYLQEHFPLLSYVETVEFTGSGALGEAAKQEEMAGVANRLTIPLMATLPFLLVACFCTCRVLCKVRRMFAEDSPKKAASGKGPKAETVGAGPLE